MEGTVLTPELKEKHWGPGEWVNEPDSFCFEHEGFRCQGVRTAVWEGWEGNHLSGGNWCGYVSIPPCHPWHEKTWNEIGNLVDCHWGVTYWEPIKQEDGSTNLLVGFDCAHSGDLIPSFEMFKQERKDARWALDMEKLKKDFPECERLFKVTYRNIEYVKDQCREIAEQAKEAR